MRNQLRSVQRQKCSVPIPISSSGVNATHIAGCSILLAVIYSIIVRISAIPALSSAPRIVVPSEVIRVLPFKEARCGKSIRT